MVFILTATRKRPLRNENMDSMVVTLSHTKYVTHYRKLWKPYSCVHLTIMNIIIPRVHNYKYHIPYRTGCIQNYNYNYIPLKSDYLYNLILKSKPPVSNWSPHSKYPIFDSTSKCTLHGGLIPCYGFFVGQIQASLIIIGWLMPCKIHTFYLAIINKSLQFFIALTFLLLNS